MTKGASLTRSLDGIVADESSKMAATIIGSRLGPTLFLSRQIQLHIKRHEHGILYVNRSMKILF